MKNWSVGRKLAAGFSLMLLILSAVGVISGRLMSRAARATTEIADLHLPQMKVATAFERGILNARIHFIYHVTIQKPGALEAGWQRYQELHDLISQLRQVVGNDGQARVTQLAADLDAYEVVLRRILEEVRQHRNQGPEFAALITEWARLGGRLVDSAGDFNRRAAETAGASALQFSADLSQGVSRTIIGCILASVLGALIAFFLTRTITRSLNRAATSLNDAAAQIALASEEVSVAAQSLAENASEQAASLEETSASCEEINSMARQSVENARGMAFAMAQSEQRSASGIASVERMTESMKAMTGSNEKVSRIIKVIDEIAFQTNILALNAAVEAARAGESGMGFAVVADEVRNLAQRSAQAAKETAGLIEGSVATTRAAFGQVADIVKTMRDVAGDAARSKSMADAVSAGSEQQTQGISQISSAITQLEGSTQRMAAGAEESAAASSELSSQALNMRRIAAELAALVAGSARRSRNDCDGG